MYQEEKLAIDEYDTFSIQYNSEIFDNISTAEQTHLDAVEDLLIKSGVEITDLQNLYNTLIEDGSSSLENALNVGVNIENQDINDLEEYLTMENANTTLVGVFFSFRDW